MRIWGTAYLAFGAKISGIEEEKLEEGLKGSGVGYLHAGKWETRNVYLTTECKSVDAGEHMVVHPHADGTIQTDEWEDAIRAAVEELGAELLSEIGWLLVADLS